VDSGSSRYEDIGRHGGGSGYSGRIEENLSITQQNKKPRESGVFYWLRLRHRPISRRLAHHFDKRVLRDFHEIVQILHAQRNAKQAGNKPAGHANTNTTAQQRHNVMTVLTQSNFHGASEEHHYRTQEFPAHYYQTGGDCGHLQKPLRFSDIPDIQSTSLAAKKEGQGGPSGRLTEYRKV
jgi:hypothetical protein